MLLHFDYIPHDGTAQLNMNPACVLGAEVFCVPDDIDELVTLFNEPQTGVVQGYWGASYVEVALLGRTHLLAVNQIFEVK